MAGHVRSFWPAGALDGALRKILPKPEKLLKPYLSPGSSALDLGCGRGRFTLGMARMVGEDGLVTAMDPREKMIRAVQTRAARAGLSQRIRAEVYSPDGPFPGDPEGLVDFCLCFHMLCQTTDKGGFLARLRPVLRPGARLLLVEPSCRVKREQFVRERAEMLRAGFVELSPPRVVFCHAALYSA